MLTSVRSEVREPQLETRPSSPTGCEVLGKLISQGLGPVSRAMGAITAPLWGRRELDLRGAWDTCHKH